ncbi:hypothetical protein [Bacillus pseudomycoides]|uniref:CDI toxin immunity protein n=1 Tax=Bacillus pseudomycoides TaxID=64104 RepID=UPI000BFC41CC|nr:hypothetical protein [Bacillus pseudomycoides]PGS03257.1 hypothetical protein COC54_17570 [Bacillus pseudomycoides]
MRDNQRKQRLEILLKKQKMRKHEDYGALFNECLISLGNNVMIFSKEKSAELYTEFQDEVPFTQYTRVDWDKVSNHKHINSLKESAEFLNQEDVNIYWSYGDFPVLKVNIEKVIRAFDDVTAVSADTYLYVPNKYVVEIHHEGEMRVGFL